MSPNILLIWCWPFGEALLKLFLDTSEDFSISCADISYENVENMLSRSFESQKPLIQQVCKQEDETTYFASIAQADAILIAPWAKYMFDVLLDVNTYAKPWALVINVNKWLSITWNILFQDFQDLERDDLTYASLWWWMAAWDVMIWEPVWASIWYDTPSSQALLQSMWSSPQFEIEYLQDSAGIEHAWVLKNILSIRSWYLLGEDLLDIKKTEIDEYIRNCTAEIQANSEYLNILPSTFDQTYCRNHPIYGDIKTSCYGNTRNMRLGKARKRLWSLANAVKECADQGITVEWYNTLVQVAKYPEHPYNILSFVKDMLEEIEN